MIINLTQHLTTPEQQTAGVVDIVSPALRGELLALLTFEDPPTEHELLERAATLAALADKAMTFHLFPQMPVRGGAMIGGAL